MVVIMRRLIGQLGKFCLYSDTYFEGTCPHIENEEIANSPYGAFNFTYGPSAGGLFESVGIDINTFGEYIRNIKVNPNYKKREIRILDKSIEDAILYIERINAAFSASHVISFLSAIDKISESDIDSDVLNLRILQIEMERIRNNLFVIERLVESAGFQVPLYQLQYLIENVNRKIGKLFGHRYFFGVNSVRKININDPKVDFTGIEREFKTIYEDIIENRIFIDRLQGNGIIKDERSIGPAARAAGFYYDARIEDEFLPYKDFDFKISTYNSADAFGRLIVRSEEIFESLRIISQIKVKSKEYKIKVNDGEGIGRVESPSGDSAYFVKVNNGKVVNIDLLSPSSINIELFSKSMVKNIFTDFSFNWESFGIWISEVGVRFI
jgi:Ni,Fe-hydrogenase III large subunit